MKKDDFELGMFVSVIQNITPLAKSRLKVKRLGKVVGIYDRFVTLLLFDSDIENHIEDDSPIVIYRKLYLESFEFRRVSKIECDLEFEGRKIL